MSVNNDGALPSVDQPDSNNVNQRRGGNRRRNQRESRFEGDCDDLKGIVYDVTHGKETFTKSTRMITEYVSRQYNDAGEFRTDIVEVSLPMLSEPVGPNNDSNFVQVEV
mmetsp:Transcript_30187/g.42774  ORF Transcript_30187/g.42774 Transcript_30187/m.42774 type:complete len:109 (+) Transcript_30187:329-655(+)